MRCTRVLLSEASSDTLSMTLPSFWIAQCGRNTGRGAERTVLVDRLVCGQIDVK